MSTVTIAKIRDSIKTVESLKPRVTMPCGIVCSPQTAAIIRQKLSTNDGPSPFLGIPMAVDYDMAGDQVDVYRDRTQFVLRLKIIEARDAMRRSKISSEDSNDSNR